MTQAYTNSLRTGNTKSCGCLQKERTSIARKKHGMSGVCKTAEYNIWLCMRNRCRTHPLYFGRGVKVCDRWNDFDNFLKDMGPRPTAHHSIERRDNNGDYCPENCSWETSKTQNRNKRNNITITHNGKTMIARDWDAELGFRPGTVTGRLYLGWTKQRAVTQKLKHRSKKNQYE